MAIARFSNETQYAKGVFYDKANDPLGKQAVDILSTKLAASGKFILLERQDMDKILEEMKIAGNESAQKVGADYLIIGSVTQFGRKNVGDVNAFSRSKSQIVEAGVSLRLVDVSTGQIIYSEEAKGEAETTNTTVMGLGERTDYDATLSDKAISAAISNRITSYNVCYTKLLRNHHSCLRIFYHFPLFNNVKYFANGQTLTFSTRHQNPILVVRQKEGFPWTLHTSYNFV